METTGTASRGRFRRTGVMEENILAILDSASDSKHAQYVDDDWAAFLEAVRVAYLGPGGDEPLPPSRKIHEAVFGILRVGRSLELMIESFRLLIELHKRFPLVYVSSRDGQEAPRLVVAEEAWSPFAFNLEAAAGERDAAGKSSSTPLDSMSFNQLIQDLAEVTNEANPQGLETKSLGNMLLFQFLVTVLEGDFVPRNIVYKESMDWNLLRESSLSMLLSSRRMNHKNLMKDCLSILCGLHQVSAQAGNDLETPENSATKPPQHGDFSVQIAFLEAGSGTVTAMQKLMIMIMELDLSRKSADIQGYTTRADGVRSPLVEMLLDELTYYKEMLTPFLQIFNEPKWKLEIILRYFSKYVAKPSVRTRRSSSSDEDITLEGILKCFSSISSTRNITKKIGTDIVQILLAHGFQVYLSLSLSQQDGSGIYQVDGKVKGCSLVGICENLISAFRHLKNADSKMEMLPIGREALFIAAAALSTKSSAHS